MENTEYEIYRIIEAVGMPDTSASMDSEKEEIWQRTMAKISHRGKSHASISAGSRRMILMAAASIAAAVIIATGFLAYHARKAPSIVSVATVAAPFGSIAEVLLPDGTKVTLNAGSALRYPVQFGDERVVNLTGEGYFDVAKDTRRPFTVKTAHVDVTALGTHFNVADYADDDNTVVTLEEGLVRIRQANDDILLKPMQQLVFNAKTGDHACKTVDTQLYTSWTKGVLDFKDLTLKEIAAILSRKFNVEINIMHDALEKEQYFAQFKHGETVEQILFKLSYRREWKYRKTENIYEITYK